MATLIKRAIVVGASSGIGKSLAKILVKNDYLVGITGRRTNLLTELKNENPDKYIIKTLDINDTALVCQQLETLTNELGGLDLLIISSGTGDLNEILDFTIEKQTIDTNVSGFTSTADWSFNYFQKQKYGHLTAISSIAGLRGGRHAPAYNASKAFQINYLQGLHQKACKLNLPITVTDIRPGFVDTDMAKGENKFWVATIEKAAQQTFEAINLKKRVAYVTKRWALVALLLKLLPDFIYEKM